MRSLQIGPKFLYLLSEPDNGLNVYFAELLLDGFVIFQVWAQMKKKKKDKCDDQGTHKEINEFHQSLGLQWNPQEESKEDQ